MGDTFLVSVCVEAIVLFLGGMISLSQVVRKLCLKHALQIASDDRFSEAYFGEVIMYCKLHTHINVCRQFSKVFYLGYMT